jgi:histidine decarboxylase
MDAMDDEKYRELAARSLGYPGNLAYDFSGVSQSFAWNLNNVGDPTVTGAYGMHAKEEELRVIDFFRELWKCPAGSRGYVTHSGTEGNLQGVLDARDALGDPTLYASQEAHYSIAKIARMLRLRTVIVASDSRGNMDVVDLAACIDPERPAVVVASVGTTMKGGIDDTDAIASALRTAGVPFRIHVDAALMGGLLPFLDDRPFFSGSVDSACVSGHKFFGVPFPCGVYMSRHGPRGAMTEVTGSLDSTVSGSRSGHGSLFLDHIIAKKGVDGFRKDALACIDTAQYFVDTVDPSWGAWRNDKSPIVVMKRAPDKIARHWQLASQGPLSHVIAMPHVTKRKINVLTRDLRVARPPLAVI